MADLPQTLPGVPAPSIDPTVEDLGKITTIDNAFQWLNTGEAARLALLGEIGGGATPALRDIVYIKSVDWETALCNIVVKVPDAPSRAPTAIEYGHFAMLRRIARLRCGLTAVEASITAPVVGGSEPGQVALLSQPPSAPGTISTEPKIKLALVLDPSLDSELVRLPQTVFRAMFTRYIAVRGAEPSEDIEPTHEQVSALHQVINNDLVPYADFSIWSPHGRRMVGKLAYCAYTFQPDGTWHKRELPGPPSWDHWWASYRVLRTAFLLLEVADPEILDNYGELIRSFVTTYGARAWFIVYNADIRMRSEHFDRIRRRKEREHEAAVVALIPSTYDPAKPWKAVFAAALTEDNWWQDNLHRPALLFLTQQRSAAETVADGTVQDLPVNVVPARERSRSIPRRATRDGQPRGAQSDGGSFTKNGKRFCDGYNSPAGCRRRDRCNDFHGCKKCRNSGHGAHECRPKVILKDNASSSLPPPPPAPGGGRRNKGGNKRGGNRH